MQDTKTCVHKWEANPFKDGSPWFGCDACQALAQQVGSNIVAVQCTDCEDIAITLNHRKAGQPPVPVCQYHFDGVIIL